MRFVPENVTIATFGIFLGILVLQTLHGPMYHGVSGQAVEDGDPCTGEPIVVDYAYDYRMLEPHACKPQCTDKKQRYILYSNHMATQCEALPGCNDWGEDHRITCIPPNAVSDGSNTK